MNTPQNSQWNNDNNIPAPPVVNNIEMSNADELLQHLPENIDSGSINTDITNSKKQIKVKKVKKNKVKKDKN